MKNIVLFFALVFSASAAASTCTYDLKDRNGYDINTFRASSYYRSEACSMARQQCQDDLIRRHRRQRDPGAYCSERYFDDGRSQDRRVCKFNLVRGNGRIIETFRSRGYNPCQEAKRECRQELRYRQSNGRNMRARCEKDGYSNPRQPRMVSKSCSVERIGRRGRFVQTHFGSAYGPQGSGVQQQACQQAMRSCRSAANHRQTCQRI